MIQSNLTEVGILHSLGEIQASLDHCMVTMAGEDKAGSTPWAAVLALYYTARHHAYKIKQLSKAKRFRHQPRHLSCFNLNRTFLKAIRGLDLEDELLPFIHDEELTNLFAYSQKSVDEALDEALEQAADHDASALAWTPETSPKGDPLKGRSDTVTFSELITTYMKCMMYALNPLEEMIDDGADARSTMVSDFKERWSALA